MTGFVEHILHVDMDAFFVEVERHHDPSLQSVPVIVGGLGGRGVVASASYEARRLGVRSAMPMTEARRRCPRGRFIPPDHRRYREASDEVFAVLRSFTPVVEGISVDEAFLDVAGLRLHHRAVTEVAHAIRLEMRNRLGLPCSVGIAATKFIAKLASAEAKPDGILLVPKGAELAFLHPLPIRRLWGVGEATHATLEGLGVATVGDLAALPERVLVQRLGSSLGAHLARLARAEDDRGVVFGSVSKSISVEETFPADLVDRPMMEQELLRLCDRLSARLRRADMEGHTLTVKVRFADFTTVSRSVTLANPMRHTNDLWEGAKSLLERARPGVRSVRLLGVGVAILRSTEKSDQLSLEPRRRNLAADAAEQVRARFGDDAVLPARLVGRPLIDETALRDGRDVQPPGEWNGVGGIY